MLCVLRTKCLCACCSLLLAAGTPLQNNMVELYGMLAFMYPDVFTTPGPFEAAFNLVKGTVSWLLVNTVACYQVVGSCVCEQHPVCPVLPAPF